MLLSKEREEEVRRILSAKFDRMMKALFRQQGASLDISIVASDEAQDFINAHASALDSGFEQVRMSDTMRRRLQRSDYIFSGMKAFHELNEAFPSLLDENGDRKPFDRFLNDVRSIDKTYNADYLRAEYNFAVASAKMAAKWEDFTADGDRYNLQYRTAGDSKVRPEHAALNGVTLPMSDPFWEEYYPPNGWNCRCTVVQVRKSKFPETPHDEAMSLGEEALQRDTKGIFHFNSGKEEQTFPDYNPYTIRRCRDCDLNSGNLSLAKTFIPDSDMCAACKKLRECWQHRKTDEPETFTRCETSNGVVRVSSLHGRTEKKENVRCATYLAEKYGYEIDLLAKQPNRVSVDSMNRTLGITQEYKVNSTATISSIDSLLRKGAKQSENIVLFVDSNIPLHDLRDAINDRVKRANIRSITVVINNKDRTYYREEMISDSFIIRQADLQ